MRPDQRWFPTGRVERAAWFQNFTTQFASAAAGLGFTQADVDGLTADNAVVQYLKQSLLATDAFAKAMAEFQKSLLLGKNRGAPSPFPAFVLPTPPDATPPGIFERLETLVRRIRLSVAYNGEYGALLGITPSRSRRPGANSERPSCRVSLDAMPYSFNVGVTKGLFNGFFVYYRRQNSVEWETAGLFFKSPCDVTVVPTQEGIPEMLGVRVRMLAGNDPIGKYSAIQSIILSP